MKVERSRLTSSSDGYPDSSKWFHYWSLSTPKSMRSRLDVIIVVPSSKSPCDLCMVQWMTHD